MKLVLDTTKSLEENAALYFEKSKKAKRKVEGIEKTIELTKKKMFFEEEKKQEQKKYVEAPQKKWYMKFRWFISSDGFLCIGGRDATKKELGLPKGAFMIHGKREYFKPIIKLYIGINKENYIECSPLKKEYPLKQEGKKTDTAKFLQQRFIEKTNIKYSVDEIMQALPGDCSVDMQ